MRESVRRDLDLAVLVQGSGSESGGRGGRGGREVREQGPTGTPYSYCREEKGTELWWTGLEWALFT